MQRSSSNNGWNSYRSAEIAIEDEDEGDDGFDEGFLPSSLNDLLTPEEMRRRTLKSQNGATLSNLSSSSPSLDQFLPSRSVPVDLLLSGGRPTPPSSNALQPPSLGNRSASAMAQSTWGAVHSSSEGHNPSAQPFTPPQSSLLATSRGSHTDPIHASSLLPPNSYLSTSPSQQPHPFYSASFNDALGPQYPSRYAQSGLSPTTNASLAAPGSSLPGGLAAGLSRLHLIPPNYTGETPPSTMLYSQALGTSPSRAPPQTNGNGGGSTSSAEGVSPRLQAATLPAPGSALARRMSSNNNTAVASPLHREVTTPNGGTRVASGGISSAGSTAGEDDLGGGEDEIQFDMDT